MRGVQRQPGGRGPRYELVAEESTSEVLVIRDLGAGAAVQSVTNAAEQVVAQLHQLGQLADGRRLYYYDSAGDLDELLHRDGQFLGFAPGPGRNAGFGGSPDEPTGE